MSLVTCVAVSVFAQVGAEQRLDTSAPLLGSPSADQTRPRLGVFDGGMWLVWVDERSGITWPGLYGARLGPAFDVLDVGGVAIANGPLGHQDPDIACSPTECLVAYSKEGAGVEAVRVGFDGAVLDATPITIGDLNTTAPGVTYNGTSYLVETFEQGHVDIYEVATGGIVTGPQTIASGNPILIRGRLASAANGETVALYAASLGANSESFAQRLSVSGGPLGAATALGVTAGELDQNLAWGPSGWFAAWDQSAGGVVIQGGRLDANGALLDPSFLTFAQQGSLEPDVAFDGAQWDIVYQSEGEVLRQLSVAIDGGFIDDHVLASPGNGVAFPAIRHAPGGTLVAFESRDLAIDQVNLGVLDGGGFDLGLGVRAQTTSNMQYLPMAAGDLSAAVAVWVETAGGAPVVKAHAVDPLGNPVGALLSFGSTDTIDGTAITASSDGFQLARFSNGVELASIGRDGSLGAAITIDEAAQFPDGLVAARRSDAGTLFVWNRYTTDLSSDIFMALMGLDGGVGPVSRWPEDDFQLNTSVAAGSDRFLVAWFDDNGNSVRFSLVGPDLSPAPAGGIIVASNTFAFATAAAFDGAHFLLAWNTTDMFGVVRAVRIDALTGEAIDTNPIAIVDDDENPFAAPQQGHVALTFDGRSYLAAWEQVSPDSGTDIWARRIWPDGGLGARFAVSQAQGEEEQPSLTTLSRGRVLVLYRAFDSSIQAMRAKSRIIAEVDLGDPCFATSECLVGVCAGCCTLDGGGCSPLLADGGAGGGSGVGAGPASGGGAGGASGAGGGASGATSDRVGCGCGDSTGWTLGATAFLLLLRRRKRAPFGGFSSRKPMV